MYAKISMFPKFENIREVYGLFYHVVSFLTHVKFSMWPLSSGRKETRPEHTKEGPQENTPKQAKGANQNLPKQKLFCDILDSWAICCSCFCVMLCEGEHGNTLLFPMRKH